MKTCTKCGQSKDLDDFYNSKKSKDGKRTECKKCESESNKKWHLDNPDKHRERSKKWNQQNPEKVKKSSKSRYQKEKINNPDRIKIRQDRWRNGNPEKARESSYKHRLKKEYNLSLEEYRQINENQNGKCAICGCNLENSHLDHDHVTGIVRGILCPPCNLGLGHFRDNPEFLVSAAEYIIKSKRNVKK